AVAALMRSNPFMLYAGQEFGEEGMQQEGFSGRDGRTSIFDYAALPCLQAWRHRKEPGAPRLQDDQLALRAFYRTVLQVAATDRTAVEGQFYDLMYAAPDGFDRSRQYAFLRYVDEELMVVVANFAENDVEVPVQIPAHAFEFLRMETDLTVACTDLIGGDIRRFTFSPDYPFRVPVPGFSAVAYRCTVHRTPPDCTLPREAGTAVPVFSLRSAHDAGIGDFADLRLLVDWAADTGQRWIQVLPVNDTTRTHSWHDSYPYNAISAFALHPLYIRLEDIGPLPAADKAGLPEPPASQEGGLDYDAVDVYKWKIFRFLYKRDGRRTLASADFRRFFEPRRFWLEPYAAFSLLRDRYGTADFRQWPAYAVYDAAAVRQLLDDSAEEAGLYYFLQYHAAKQLQAVHDYARRRGVSLKGDIPIGVSRDGADIWSQPALFDDTMSAGAPPDDFSDDGQNWGFPLYRWDVMAADGYQWWRQRLQTMAAYFDAYRLDHILGFFRIFAIPRTARSGLLGYFRPARPLQPADMRKWGIVFDRNRCTLPWLDEAWLHERFAPDELAFVRKVFLQAVGDGVFTLRPAYRTQAAVAARCAADRSGIFEGRPQLQSRIEALCCEVLLIHDTQAGGYHPRISCWKSRSFQALSPEEQKRFMAMYHDYFYVRHTAFWKAEAMRKLPALCAAADMLVCGEDLGMIPDSVPEVLRELHILSLEIFRMPKVPGIPFGILKNNPYESVCTTSSHDTSTLRGWWEEQHDDACRYYHEVLRLDGDVPYFCEPWLCERILAAHLQSPSRLAIFPLQDWLAVDGEVRAQDARAERINVPADTRHYWRYRMHLTLERLLGETALNDKIRRLVQLRQFPL
ncbi:MAG: 4-alpha-glucanotransferase, partial [Bacteroidales bacterium]|nr:4-alpha-glucanotransferase [Bacteroidales bacterium]